MYSVEILLEVHSADTVASGGLRVAHRGFPEVCRPERSSAGVDTRLKPYPTVRSVCGLVTSAKRSDLPPAPPAELFTAVSTDILKIDEADGAFLLGKGGPRGRLA